MKKVGPESAVLKAVMDYLTHIKRWPCWRRNVGGGRFQNPSGKQYFVRFAEVGQSDVWFIADGGIHGEIETKAPGRKPSPEQYNWLESVNRAGGIAIWCCSVDECEFKLKAIFIERGIKWR